jgi:hypothetical protein
MKMRGSKLGFAMVVIFLFCAFADLSEPCLYNSPTPITPVARFAATPSTLQKTAITLASDDDYFYCAKRPPAIQAALLFVFTSQTLGCIELKPELYSSLQKEVLRQARSPTAIKSAV